MTAPERPEQKPGLQVVLAVPREPALVAGLPAVVRTAHRLASQEGVGRVLLVDASDELLERTRPVLARLPVHAVSGAALGGEIGEGLPVLVVASDGMPSGDGLRRFWEEAGRRKTPAAWTWKGRAVSVYEPAGGRDSGRPSPGSPSLLRSALEDSSVVRFEAGDEAWVPLETAEQQAAAEKRLYAGLSHGGDGFISQFDRPISIALSRRLARTRVTPNQITAASLGVGLAGVALVASPDRATCFAGTLLLWVSSILDGCDGEIARIKLLASEAGRRFDLFGDYVVNFSTFLAIVWHVHRRRPELSLLPLALLLLLGVAISGFSAWRLFLKDPGRRPEGLLRILQRFASRDFVYLLLPLALLGHLDWFFYAAAFGSHVFWMALLAISIVLRRKARPAEPGG